jgi:adenylate cyclase
VALLLSTNPMERKLTAILCADVYGYSRLMGEDEEGTLRTLSACRKITDSLIERHHGRFVNSAGDSILAEFASVVEAVTCAVSIQTALRAENAELPLERRMQFRIGVNLGDVMVEGEQIYGDGVNVAARLETLAEPGGICISDVVHGQVRTKLALRYQDLGERYVKNIAEPVRVLRVLMDGTIPAANPAKTIAGTKRHMLLAVIGVLLLAVIIYGVVKWRSPGGQIAQQPSANARTIRSIAVLPLDNFSGDPNQEYFADGMTDELTTDLASISAIRVISRTSVMQYKGAHRPPAPEIAKALNVDGLVEGSVLRIGDRVRITAQLIDASADKHLWAQSFERTSHDVLALQDELAAAIAREIDVQLTPREQARLTSARPVNPEAHEAYLKGRYFLSNPSPENLPKALTQFEHATQLDPGFAHAYAGLSDAYSLGMVIDQGSFSPVIFLPKAEAAAKKALQLDNTLAEAHCSLAQVLLFDWKETESEYRQAIALNPNYAYAHDQYALMLAWLGRFDEAITESMRAAELDPLSPEIHADWALVLAWQGNYQAAMEQAHRGLDLDPTSYFTQYSVGYADIQAGRISQAIPELQKSQKIGAAYLGYAYAVSGDRTRAMGVLEKLRQGSEPRYVSQVWPAIIYLGLGDRQRSLQGLEKAYEARDPWLTGLKVDRVFDPLRSDPRFIELMRKVGLNK